MDMLRKKYRGLPVEFDPFYKNLEDQFRGSNQSVKERLEIYTPFLNEVGSYTTSKLAIDLGCGRCEWLQIAEDYNVAITGVDIDDFMIKEALSNGLRVINSDAISYLQEIPDDSVALITAFHIAEHLEFGYLRELISQAYRCLAPGGVLVIETPNPENIYTASVSFNLDPSHRKPLPPALLSFLVQHTGFVRTNILRINENKKNNRHVTLVDVIYNVSPDYSIIAQKSGYKISSEVDNLFSLKTGLLLDSLAHDYDGNLREFRENIGAVDVRFSDVEESISVVADNLSALRTSSKEQGEWVLSFSQQQANHIKLLEIQIQELQNKLSVFESHPLFSLFPFFKQKTLEFYWTITRLLGYGHWHDGSRNIESYDSDVSANRSFASHQLKDRNLVVNLAYHRINHALNFLKFSNNNMPVSLKQNSNDKLPLMAYLTPLPPQKTGIANYSLALLPSLQEFYNVVVIVEGGVDARAIVPTDSVNIKDHYWFEEHAYQFDRIVYQFGNSEFHTYMLDLLKKFPGVVELHDFYLGHFIGALDQISAYKGIWANELYYSEGYNALIKRFKEINVEETITACPVNFSIIQQALGVIFHNNFSLNLSKSFYGEKLLSHSRVVPLGQSINKLLNRDRVRNELGIGSDDILICSFGFLGPTKLSQDIYQAWKHAIFNGKHVHLIFVGEAPVSDYCFKLQKEIEDSGNPKVKITGYISNDFYQKYLTACDIAVQLRVKSRGETSAALLDCMAAGIATIISNNGPFSELPENCVYKLAEDINIREISLSLSRLANNSRLRADLGRQAKRFVETELSFTDISKKYANVIEEFYRTAPKLSNLSSIFSIAKLLNSEANDRERIICESEALTDSFQILTSKPQLLIDISALAREDLNTGIQRYTKAQIVNLIFNPPKNFRVEPIYLDLMSGKPIFRYANSFTLKLLNISDIQLQDNPVVFNNCDVYYMPDLCYWSVKECEENKIYSKMRNLGVKLHFVVFDILPITHPTYFPPAAKLNHAKWLNSILRNANGLICISQSVKDEISAWIRCSYSGPDNAIDYHVLHLGSDFNHYQKDDLILDDINHALLKKLKSETSFLMVGTIEPRKGHMDVLDAFDKLWDNGQEINLVIVGSEGWKNVNEADRRSIPEIVNRLKSHPESGNRLFWVSDASDDFLEALYNSVNCLIMASYGEGFGLPLIEAAKYNLPIIARDISVFREVIGNNAVFFDNCNVISVADAIITWLNSFKDNTLPSSSNISVLTWEKNVENLKRILSLNDI